MAKRKKNKADTIKAFRGFGKKSLNVELDRVNAYALKNNWQAAYEILKLLVEQYPENQRVWEYLAEVSYEMRDLSTCQQTLEKLLEFTPDNADALYILGNLYMAQAFPFLAFQFMERALAVAPDHKSAPHVQKLLKEFTPQIPELLKEFGSEDIEMAILHERGQMYLAQGDYAATCEVEREVIRCNPQFMPAHNNLALAHWLEGQVEEAIAITQAVLDSNPSNIHALSNLVRFCVLSGDQETAQVYGDRLKASQEDAWDPWTKRVEGLSYLADDQGIVEMLNRAEANKVEDSRIGALFFHLTAVALARTGDSNRAINQWKKALKHDPDMTLAQENLRDIRRPVGERYGAWPFNWQEWLLPTTSKDIYAIIKEVGKNSKAENIQDLFEQLFKDHPDILTILPRIMERGGPVGQEFGLRMVEHVEIPKLPVIIKDFALSQNGTDKMRNQAASIATRAGLIPKNQVTLWIRGKWQDVVVVSYEISPEPTIHHSKAVKKLLHVALPKLHQGDHAGAVEAEKLLKDALKLEPDAPDIYNNLAMAYTLQGRKAEANALMDELFEQFPDYLFARCAKAKNYLDDGNIDAAQTLITSMLSRDRFHTSEFTVFSDTYLSLLVKQNEVDKARSWLGVWQQIGSESKALTYWINKLSKLQG